MKILALLLSMSVSITGYSQNDNYIITNSGDTIWGHITIKNKVFYVSGDEPFVVDAYNVNKIKSNEFKGNIVLRCKLETYTDNLDELEIDWIEKKSIDTVMILEEIYSTKKMNLYFAKSDIKTHYYFYKTPSDLKPVQLVIRFFFQGGLDNYLQDRARFRGDRSKVNLVEVKGYVNQLRSIMGDCKNITEPMWELLSYRDYSLKQLIKKYDNCN